MSKSKHIPQVLTKGEVQKVIANLTGAYQLIVYLMYLNGIFSRWSGHTDVD